MRMLALLTGADTALCATVPTKVPMRETSKLRAVGARSARLAEAELVPPTEAEKAQ